MHALDAVSVFNLLIVPCDDDVPDEMQRSIAAAASRYCKARRAMLLLDAPSGRAIIEDDGRKVGLVLWQHPTRETLDVAGLGDIPTSVIDIDIMIGEVMPWGRGSDRPPYASSPRERWRTRGCRS